MTSTSLVRMLGAALLVAAGCGSSSPGGRVRQRRPARDGAGRDDGERDGGHDGERRRRDAGRTAARSGRDDGERRRRQPRRRRRDDGDRNGRRDGQRGTGGIKVGNPQCSDGIDNDGDGKIDYDDPECVGPLDNDESSFATGIPGDNMDACKQDCFFDGNSGMGDDGCLWQLKCDPQSVEPKCPYDQQYAPQHTDECSVSASQSQTCIDKCRKLVPNGCDCFGCCLIPGARDADSPGGDLHGGRLRRPDQVPALHAGDPVLEPVRATARSASASRRCRPTARRTTADAGTDSAPPPPHQLRQRLRSLRSGHADPADGCGTNYGCVTGCCLPTSIRRDASSSRGPSSGCGPARPRSSRWVRPASSRGSRRPRSRADAWRYENGRAAEPPRYWHARDLACAGRPRLGQAGWRPPPSSSSCSPTLPYQVYVRSGLRHTLGPAA